MRGGPRVLASEYVSFDPTAYLKDRETVDVYIHPDEPERYFVDTSFLPKSDPDPSDPLPRYPSGPLGPGDSATRASEHASGRTGEVQHAVRKQENEAGSDHGEGVEDRAPTAMRRSACAGSSRLGRDPFNEIEWENMRDALDPRQGRPRLRAAGRRVPEVLVADGHQHRRAKKYFRGRMTSPDRGKSVNQMIGRIVDTVGGWGRYGRLLRRRRGSGRPSRTSSRRSLSTSSPLLQQPGLVQRGLRGEGAGARPVRPLDRGLDGEDILNWIRREGVIFRGGSGWA